MEKKPKYVHPFKRILSLVLAFVMLLSMVPVTHANAAEDTTVYLKPNSNWLQDDARFAIYYWNDSGDSWTDLIGPDDNGVYEGSVPSGYPNLIFCRMNPDTEENSWDNKWNQSSDLSLPTNGNNLYTVAEGTWDRGDGSWSVYTVEEDGEPSEDPSEDASEEPSSSPTTTPVVTTAPEEEEQYFVAGDAALCGTAWAEADPANLMTLTEDGTYEKVYTDVAANTYNLKVTDGTWDNSWGDNGQNYTFVVSAVCDVTVTFDPATGTVSVTGANVGRETGLEVSAMYAVGNGSGAWLNGVNWDPASSLNAMTETSEGIYEITFEDVPAGSAYMFKFAANGNWTHSWGAGGAAGEAVYNGQDIKLAIDYALADVTLTLDLTGYDHSTKNGATYTVTVTEVVAEPEEPAVNYYLIGYINGADYGCEADAANLGEYKFVDGKLTATFTQDSYVFVKTDDGKWFMSEGYAAEPPATLYDTSIGLTEANKLFVPGNVELEFTLTENNDGTLTLNYSEKTTEPEEPAVDYYLIGYINGTDYGCEADAANLGEYKFVDGKLTATFTQDSYVFVKTNDGKWFMSEGYAAEPPATLYDTSIGLTEANKLFVPGNEAWEFTLVENDDGTLTLSYAVPAVTTDVTIHFLKPDSWGSTINAWVWNDGGAIPGYEQYQTAWPGSPIDANSQHSGWYDLVISTEEPTAFSFIFNDGGNQTADLSTGEITGDTELWVVGNDVMTTAPGEWSGDYDYTANLHFQKPENWADTINAWIWDANGTIPGYEDYNTTWPGKAVDADPINSGWYNVSVTMDENTGFFFIFNDGTGNQTADLSTGTLDVITDLWIVNQQVQTEAPDGWKDPGRTIHVPGTFPGPSWDAASNQMSWVPELGLYLYTFEDVPAANYEYKIAINGSWNENYGAGGVQDGSNIAVAVPETMDVTVYYNDETHNSVTSVSYIFADVTLAGTGIPEGTKMTDKGLTGIYTVTVPMAAGTYTDLVITCDKTAENFGEVATYTFGEVKIDEDKDITFYLDPVTEIFYCDASDIPVNTTAIAFDSQNELFKKPFGAVATGEDVRFAIDTGADITSAVLVVKGVGSYPMTAEETESGKYWSVTTSFSAIGEYDYYFSLSNGSTVTFYSDDDGYYGEGRATDLKDVKPYDLVVYKAGFETPDWMKDAVIYQIFPDRFFDGDVSNNLAQTWARGEVNYEYINDWYTLPENPEQKAMMDEASYKATGAHWGDGEWSNEIYGGDLEGITERIGYLKALGVNVIYLNPIFWSISNHRYDAVDYTEIDPILGTMGDFRELVKVAEANDMHIILDGVFNHVSDDSVYFDRYYKFLPDAAEKFGGKIGAYPYWAYVYDHMAETGADQAAAEAAAKAFFSQNYGICDYSYTEWFAVSSKTMAGTVDNIGLRAGKAVYSYEGWWGYDSMPVIYSTNGSEYQTGNWAQEIISNSQGTSVTQYWISQGNNGWRLDVANEVSDETWQRFRDSVKALDSDAVIIGEIWDDATKYLKGDMYDSVMNYLFRNAAIGFAKGEDADQTVKELEKIRERYPREAFYAMMNLVGSHDTTRLLSYLDDIDDDRNQKDPDSAFPTYEKTSDIAKQMQYLVAFLQFTYPGAPTIYYGDEIGMVGADDPDDRRAMEWGKGNRELVEWYAKLAAIRAAYPALRTGSIRHLDSQDTSLLHFIREDASSRLLIYANNSGDDIAMDLTGSYVELTTGRAITDSTVSIPAYSGLILVEAEDAKTISVNYAGLAPAYDPAYIVNERAAAEHVHKYDAVVTDPTCTDGGFTTYTCSCGDSYIAKEIPALGHDYDVVTAEPTCTEDGSSVHTCLRCGDTYSETLEALDHSYSYTDADGIRTYTCENCGDTYSSKVTLLASGKSLTLKFVHPKTHKTVSASKVNWKIEDIFAVNPYKYNQDMSEYLEPIDPQHFSAYATLKNGKLKTYKNGDRISILVTASLKADPAITESYCIELTPSATKLSIWAMSYWSGEYDAPVFRDYIAFSNVHAEYRAPLTFIATTYPVNANTEIKWKSSNNKIATIEKNPDGSVTVQPVKNAKTGAFKTGTVTITATAADGSGKSASFKIKFVKWGNWVKIFDKNGQELPSLIDWNKTEYEYDEAGNRVPTGEIFYQIDWSKTFYIWDPETGEMIPEGDVYYMRGFTANAGSSVQLTAKSDLNQKITWACYSEYATISKSGKLTIKPSAPNGSEIYVSARVKNSGLITSEDEIVVTVRNDNPPVKSMRIHRVEKTDSGFSFENMYEHTEIDVSDITAAADVPVYSYTVTTNNGFPKKGAVTWKSSNTNVAKVSAPYQDETTGAWLVDVKPVFKNGKCATGTVTITAAVNGLKQSFKLTYWRPVTELRIETKNGKNMGTYPMEVNIYDDDGMWIGTELQNVPAIFATAGQTLNLTAITNKGVSNKGFLWEAHERVGSEGRIVKVSSAGKLTIPKDIVEQSVVYVRVQPKDLSYCHAQSGMYFAEIPIIVSPKAVNVHLRADFSDGMKYVSNSTKVWDIHDGTELQLSSLVYPFTASQNVKWTVSNKNIAAVVENKDGTATLKFTGKKLGTLTVTATAEDGSKVKTSFKLNVVRSVKELTVAGDGISVTAGKQLKLASKLTVNPANASNKKVSWSVSENNYGVKINASTGVLTTKKALVKDNPVTVIVTATAKDGYGATVSFEVTIRPAK